MIDPATAPAGAAARVASPRLFFVHIMKTAGMALTYAFNRNVDARHRYRVLLPSPDTEDGRWVEGLLQVLFKVDPRPLAAMSERERARLRFVNGHFPLAASELLGGGIVRLAVLRHPVDRSVSHLRQLARSEGTLDEQALERRYDSESVFRRFIHNHQTKIFSMSLEESIAPRPTDLAAPLLAFRDALLALAAARSSERQAYRLEEVLRLLRDPETSAHVRSYRGREADSIVEFFGAPFAADIGVDRQRRQLALDRLGEIEIVGLTERLPQVQAEVEAAMGWPHHELRPRNVGEPVEVSRAFRRRIERDNEADMELYERACELVRARSGS